MSPLRWIGEEEADDCELPPLPKVYRLNDPEMSAEDPSADFSAFGAFEDTEAADEEPWDADGFCEEAIGFDGEEEPAVPRKYSRFAPAVQELPADGVTLSDIRPTKRGRMALFFLDAAKEEQFLFSVDEETCALQHLRPGTVLSGTQLEAVRSQSDLRRAKDRALQYLSVRDHASGELYRKLSEKFDEPTAAAAVAEMDRLGLLNDAAFAARRAAYLAQKGKSRREIGRLLAGLGISREDRETALEQLPDAEEETLRRLVEKQYKSKLAAGKRDTVAAALARRGYSGSLIRRILAEYEEE